MRLKETYLNNDITEAWTGRNSKRRRGTRGGWTVEVKKEGDRGDEREPLMKMSAGCDTVSGVQRGKEGGS